MTIENIPALDTPEARWAYVLTLWHTRSLPTPDLIDIGGDSAIWLPRNERGQVEAWAAAMGIADLGHLGDLVKRDGSAKDETYYVRADWSGLRFGVYCNIGLTADAEAHGGPMVRSDLTAAADSVVAMLAATEEADAHDHGGTYRRSLGAWALNRPSCAACDDAVSDYAPAADVDGVVSMLADEPNPVCNKQIAIESFCALNSGHDGDCDPVLHGPVPRPGACVCGFEVDVWFTAPELIDEKLAIHIDGGA